MILHDFALSSASYRVRIALELKGLPYQKLNYSLRAGEHRDAAYASLNPACLLPTLEVGNLVLTQSLAIIDWLDTTYPEPRLIPGDSIERAHAMAIALTVACDIHPLNNLRVLQYLENQLALDASIRDRWYAEWVTAGFTAIETMLSDGRGRPGDGDRFGIVEICLVPQVYNARRYHVDLSPFPCLTAMADRAADHPAFRRAVPEAPIKL